MILIRMCFKGSSAESASVTIGRIDCLKCEPSVFIGELDEPYGLRLLASLAVIDKIKVLAT